MDMIVRTTSSQEMLCWIIAISVHMLLFLIHFQVVRHEGLDDLVPLIEIEYVVGSQIQSVPAPYKEKGFFKKVANKFF